MKTKAELQEELDKQSLELETLRKIATALASKPSAPLTEPVKETDTETALRAQLKNTSDQLDKVQTELNLLLAEKKAATVKPVTVPVVEEPPVQQPVIQQRQNQLPVVPQYDVLKELKSLLTVLLICGTLVACAYFFFHKGSNVNPDHDKDRNIVILKQPISEISYLSRPVNQQDQWTLFAEKLIRIADSEPKTLQEALGEIRFYLETVDQGDAWGTWRKNVGTKLLEEAKQSPEKLPALLREAAAGLMK